MHDIDIFLEFSFSPVGMFLSMSDLDKKSGVYLIRHSSNKVYIGHSNDLKKRFEKHKWFLRVGSHTNRLLQEDYKKDPHVIFYFALTINKGRAFDAETVLLNRYFGEPYVYNLYPAEKANKTLSNSTKSLARSMTIKNYYKNNPTAGLRVSAGIKKYLANNPEALAKLIQSRLDRQVRIIIDGVEYESLLASTSATKIPSPTLRRRLRDPKFPMYYYKKDMYERQCIIKNTIYNSVNEYSIESGLSKEIALSRIFNPEEQYDDYVWVD